MKETNRLCSVPHLSRPPELSRSHGPNNGPDRPRSCDLPHLLLLTVLDLNQLLVQLLIVIRLLDGASQIRREVRGLREERALACCAPSKD
jgi:hypothetical protein